MAYDELIELRRCAIGRGTFVEHGERELAVFRLCDGRTVVVADNACPHAGGNLSGGALAGTVVTCPWHGWPFDLRTGACVHSDTVRVRCYPVDVRDGIVYADLGAPAACIRIESSRPTAPGKPPADARHD